MYAFGNLTSPIGPFKWFHVEAFSKLLSELGTALQGCHFIGQCNNTVWPC